MIGALRTGIVCYAICLVAALSSAYASFELKPLPPAERGAATHLVGSESRSNLSGCEPGAVRGVGIRSVQVYGFRPFGIEEAAFIGVSVDFTLREDLDIRFGYQGLSVLSYVEETYVVSCHWTTGILRFVPTVRGGTVRLEHSVIDHALLFDIACYVRIAPDIELFVGARNPLALGLAHADERCPADAAAGLGYDVCKSLTFAVEATKEAGFPTSISSGVEVRFVQGIALRTGIRTDPKEFCLGLGVDIGRIALDVSASLHNGLGTTHAAGLTYRRR
jgi:hypothetical protein